MTSLPSNDKVRTTKITQAMKISITQIPAETSNRIVTADRQTTGVVAKMTFSVVLNETRAMTQNSKLTQ